MFRIETIVKLAICVWLPFGYAVEEKSKNVSVTQNADESAYKIELYHDYKADNCLDHPTTPKCLKLDSMMKGAGATTDGCQDSSDKYNTAKSEFSSACGDANISKDGKVACEMALLHCRCADKKNEGSVQGADSCQDGDAEEPVSTRGASSSDKKTLSRYGYCPAQAASNYDKIKEDKDKADDKADELEDKIPEKTEEANKVKSDGEEKAQDKMTEIKQKETEAKTKYGEKQLEASKGLSASQKAIKDQITQLEAQALSLDEQASDLELKAADASIARGATITQIQLNCHASASAQAAKAMGEAADKIRAGVYNLGGQKGMLKRNGTTLETIFDREALKIYNKCLASKPTKDSINNANQAYESAVQKTQVAKAAAKKRKDALGDSIKQLKDPTGSCGQVTTSADGTNNETEMCRTQREFKEAQAQQAQAFNDEIQGLEDQKTSVAQALQRSTNEYNTKMAAVQQLSGKAAKQRAKADSLERQLAAGDNAGGPTDKKAYTTANAKFLAFTATATTLLTCKNVCPDGKASKGGDVCAAAADYLTEIGSLKDVPDSPPVEPPPPVEGNDAASKSASKSDKKSKSSSKSSATPLKAPGASDGAAGAR